MALVCQVTRPHHLSARIMNDNEIYSTSISFACKHLACSPFFGGEHFRLTHMFSKLVDKKSTIHVDEHIKHGISIYVFCVHPFKVTD